MPEASLVALQLLSTPPQQKEKEEEEACTKQM
jgi:hypothetical protein